MPMPRVLFAAPALWARYRPHLGPALAEAGVEAEVVTEAPDPAAVDWIVTVPGGPIADFRPYVRARAVLSLWAGVERFLADPTLVQPLCRMVDPAMTGAMTEWVAGHALRHHLGMDRHIVNPRHLWQPEAPPPAGERPVSVLGLGELGAAAARALAALGFPVTGWSRTPRAIAGIRCLSGEEGLAAALSTAAILVLMLPRTPATENLIDARRLALLPRGAVLLNPARGHLIDDAALLAALDAGQVGQATLDVFRREPLPPDDPYWHHPRVTVTPHVAAETNPATAARVIAANIARGEAGLPLLHRVDPARGY